jgi:hypothetical protein
MRYLNKFFFFIKNIYYKKSLDKNYFFPRVKTFKPTSYNTSFVTVLNDEFLEYFLKFASSLKKHNENLDYNWYIFYNNEISNLSNDSKLKIKSVYSNIHFKHVSEKNYLKFKNYTPKQLYPAMLKLELFKMTKYKKIICFDTDTICLGSIDYLLNNEFAFAAVQGGTDYNKINLNSSKFNRNIPFNTGIMVIGYQLLNNKNYKKLISFNGFAETADQSLLNEFLKFYPVFSLPIEYNFFADIFHNYFKNHKVKILHFKGPKPHANKNEPLAHFWNEFNF